MSKHNYCEKP